MKKALVLVAHPFSAKSRVNRTIMETLRGYENVLVHDLYEEYPYFHINVEREQELLKATDLIVWHHPLYWFSMPPLMKLWCDQVLRKGFAFGSEGDQLQGKDFMLSLTTGGLGDPETRNQVDENLFLPYQKTAEVCGLRWQKPLILTDSAKATQEQVVRHAESVRRVLKNYCAEMQETP